MIIWTLFIITIIVSYLLGSINTSIVITKFMGSDIRNFGSGNAGATNMLRTFGKKAAALALAGDLIKGVVAVLLGMYLEHLMRIGILGNVLSPVLLSVKYFCAVAVVLGHNYPIFFGFKGGKGIGTSLAVILVLDWRIGLILLVLAIIIMAISKYVSLGSVIGAIAFPFITAVFTYFIDKDANYAAIITAISIAALAVYRHKSNIQRLINGTESKLGKSKEITQ